MPEPQCASILTDATLPADQHPGASAVAIDGSGRILATGPRKRVEDLAGPDTRVERMAGCSVWPAFWSQASVWPEGGEVRQLH